MPNEFAPGEEYAFIFDQPREVQLQRLAKQVEGLAVPSTPDEVLDTALAEIGFTIHIIRDAIFARACARNRAAARVPYKSAAIPSSPNTLDDIT